MWGLARCPATSTEALGSAGVGLALSPPDSKKSDEASEKETEADNKADVSPSSEEPIEGVKSKEEAVEETLARYSTEYRKVQQPPQQQQQQQPDSPPISVEEEAKKGFRQWERSATKRQWSRFGKAPPQEAKPKKAPTAPPLLWAGKSETENAVMREILGDLISLVRYPTMADDILFGKYISLSLSLSLNKLLIELYYNSIGGTLSASPAGVIE